MSAASSGAERKVVLVTRRTRLEELVQRHHTLAQAQFYIEHMGADFGDYLRENAAYSAALQITVATLQQWGRYQLVDRAYLPNFMFGADDIVVALGQDGLVANTMKYLDGQPLIGLNPEPARWDGVLLPFQPAALGAVLKDVARDRCKTKSATMAEAVLSDGQVLRAVNDLFIGPRSHTSANYELSIGKRHEVQSSSGLIVATGLGSTAWIKSIITSAHRISLDWLGIGNEGTPPAYRPMAWSEPELLFAVREPFPAKNCGTDLVFGRVAAQERLTVRSRMPEHGVIFSDGMEQDFLRFSAGMEASIGVAATAGKLVV